MSAKDWATWSLTFTQESSMFNNRVPFGLIFTAVLALQTAALAFALWSEVDRVASAEAHHAPLVQVVK